MTLPDHAATIAKLIEQCDGFKLRLVECSTERDQHRERTAYWHQRYIDSERHAQAYRDALAAAEARGGAYREALEENQLDLQALESGLPSGSLLCYNLVKSAIDRTRAALRSAGGRGAGVAA